MYQVDQWQPTASMSVLIQRAQLLRRMRHFFDQLNVMEVDTQSLSLASIADPHIEVLTTQAHVAGQATTYYLQTSPEFAMKRLLCAGAGSIYQLAKVYRAEDLGRRHAIEFTLLEWYRVGLDHWQLMTEIEQLLQAVTQDTELRCESLSYQQAFERHLGINPHQDKGEPVKNGITMFVADIVGGAVPLAPYFFLPAHIAMPVSMPVTLVGLFILGVFVAKFTAQHWFRAGLKLVIFGGIALAVGYFIGVAFGVS